MPIRRARVAVFLLSGPRYLVHPVCGVESV